MMKSIWKRPHMSEYTYCIQNIVYNLWRFMVPLDENSNAIGERLIVHDFFDKLYKDIYQSPDAYGLPTDEIVQGEDNENNFKKAKKCLDKDLIALFAYSLNGLVMFDTKTSPFLKGLNRIGLDIDFNDDFTAYRRPGLINDALCNFANAASREGKGRLSSFIRCNMRVYDTAPIEFTYNDVTLALEEDDTTMYLEVLKNCVKHKCRIEVKDSDWGHGTWVGGFFRNARPICGFSVADGQLKFKFYFTAINEPTEQNPEFISFFEKYFLEYLENDDIDTEPIEVVIGNKQYLVKQKNWIYIKPEMEELPHFIRLLNMRLKAVQPQFVKK